MRLWIIVLGLSLLLMALTINSAYNQWTFTRSAISTNGTVLYESQSKTRSTSKTFYTPVISFVTNTGENITISSRTSNSFSSYASGDKVNLIYNPKNPYQAEFDSFFSLWGGYLILIFLDLIFTLIGIVLYFASNPKKHAPLFWRKSFRTIQTTYVSTYQDLLFCINGDYSYVILTQWLDPQTNNPYTFRSERLWYDPSPFIEQLKLVHIPVKVFRSNYKNYIMDISMLPQVKNPPL